MEAEEVWERYLEDYQSKEDVEKMKEDVEYLKVRCQEGWGDGEERCAGTLPDSGRGIR